jgi:acetyl/propionyl-CoA carboxylase alpha subunit/acetyl-CoA carboxylase carboxyltransferase component
MLTRPFNCVAIPNRGEAAVRFMRAARTWGREHGAQLSVIALYTHPDADAPFVRMASSAICLGDALVPGPGGKLRSAYLDLERVVKLARRAGADALWPGWGFASERPELQEMCEDHGLVFLGPPAQAMRMLGDKIAAKRLAEDNGVPVSPWSRDPVSEASVADAAKRIGYPVLLKAAAGGGGRGIRRVQEPGELIDAFRSAAAEAAAAFGDPSIFVESFVAQARHIEVQVLADAHGGVWALGTRDCSMQRRQQKVLEEAPAPGLAPAVEQGLREAAAKLARACRYVSAGTAEFLLLPDGKTFYFLEMNTRLQVEHTVSEEVHGIDLVGAQIEIGRGQRLPAAGPPPARGVAIEARLNAEDPDQDFAPRAGRLERFGAPQGPGIRVDSGYEAGSVVPTVFDSMLAKIIAHGATRQQALARLETALRDTVAVLESGLTNRALLLELVSQTAFRQGPVHTRWLDEHLAGRAADAGRRHLGPALAAAVLGDYMRARRGLVANFIEEAQRGLPRNVPEPGRTTFRYVMAHRPIEVDVAALGADELLLRCGQWEVLLRARPTGERTFVLEIDGQRYSAQRVATATEVHVDIEGEAHRFLRLSDGRLRAPLPASVAQIHVRPGQRVAAGARLLTLEAMKMETAVESPLAGTVRAVHVRPASQVAAGEVMIELDVGEAGEAVAEQAPPLPPRRARGPDPLRPIEARLLGFDVAPEDVRSALAALEREERPPRARLLRLLRAAVVQEQLFKSGPYDDARNAARESSLEQLAWFAHHRRLDEERLSPRYLRRLRRFLALHGIDAPVAGEWRIANALLRLFQSRSEQDEAGRLLLAILRALARSAADAGVEAAPSAAEQRVIFEKLANEAVQRGDLQVATAAWNLIYRWHDQPEQAAEAEDAARQAQALWDDMGGDAEAGARAALRTALLDLPLAALVRALVGPGSRRDPGSVLGLVLERIYEVPAQVAQAPLLGHACRALRANAASGSAVTAVDVFGVLVDQPCDLAPIVRALPADAQADLLLGFVPTEPMLAAAGGIARPRWSALWVEAGAMQVRTWVDGREQALLRDFHPALLVARELARYSRFALERLPAPPGILLLRGAAPGDERLIALAKVERFDTLIDGHFVRAPGLERAFLDAVQALREGLRAAPGRPPVLNRIALCVRPVVTLGREQLQDLAERLAPATFDLGLDKVAVLGRFTFGGAQPPREQAVEWRDATAFGARVEVHPPRERPVDVRSAYEQQVLVARQRKLFHPYEVVDWLTTRSAGGGRERGRFEELDLAEDGSALVSVRGRRWGENAAGIVVGLIVNWSPRFPEGLRRVLLLGDPTRDMGSLGEPECRRIIAAIDLAAEQGLPLEWVALSGGARIAFDSGTENLDWTAAVLRRLVEFTARGGVANVIVDGPCVGAQSYWNAEATMLMHCRGTLVMTPRGYMVLTGKRALEVSGSVAAATNEAIGGLEIMTANGQAQYTAPDLNGAYELLLRHYEYTHVPPGERCARALASSDPPHRDVTGEPYGQTGFEAIGEIFAEATNPGRKKAFAIRPVMQAVLDRDAPPLERWEGLAGGETTVVMHGQLGGQPVCLIGIESQPLPRRGARPVDGPAGWMSGTLFPHSSRKMARAIRAASGVCPLVVLANLSGFDGSPESMRERQLEYGAEIGKAVVEFDGPVIFCVIARYHGGAYVVFSRRLSSRLEALALEGSYASVIGGGAAAAVVFTRLVSERVAADGSLRAARAALAAAPVEERRRAQGEYEAVLADTRARVQAQVAREFDTVHSVARALEVGSLHAVCSAQALRPVLCERLTQAVQEWKGGGAGARPFPAIGGTA